jgi:hypothetical protein
VDTSRNENRWPPYGDDYQFVMSGAHTKPAYEVGAPSITWHVGFWKAPYDLSKSAPETSFRRHDQWILAIENLILDVFNRLEAHKEKEPGRWRDPDLSNLQPSKKDDSETLRLLRRSSTADKQKIADASDGPNKCMTSYETVHIDGVWHSMRSQ